jgi:hypothetical protein
MNFDRFLLICSVAASTVLAVRRMRARVREHRARFPPPPSAAPTPKYVANAGAGGLAPTDRPDSDRFERRDPPGTHGHKGR